MKFKISEALFVSMYADICKSYHSGNFSLKNDNTGDTYLSVNKSYYFVRNIINAMKYFPANVQKSAKALHDQLAPAKSSATSFKTMLLVDFCNDVMSIEFNLNDTKDAANLYALLFDSDLSGGGFKYLRNAVEEHGYSEIIPFLLNGVIAENYVKSENKKIDVTTANSLKTWTTFILKNGNPKFFKQDVNDIVMLIQDNFSKSYTTVNGLTILSNFLFSCVKKGTNKNEDFVKAFNICQDFIKEHGAFKVMEKLNKLAESNKVKFEDEVENEYETETGVVNDESDLFLLPVTVKKEFCFEKEKMSTYFGLTKVECTKVENSIVVSWFDGFTDIVSENPSKEIALISFEKIGSFAKEYFSLGISYTEDSVSDETINYIERMIKATFKAIMKLKKKDLINWKNEDFKMVLLSADAEKQKNDLNTIFDNIQVDSEDDVSENVPFKL